jgi:hypothetical protein
MMISGTRARGIYCTLPQAGGGLGLGRIVALCGHAFTLPDSLTYSVLLFLKRQCDRTLRRPRPSGTWTRLATPMSA